MPNQLSATEYRLLVEHSPVMSWRSGVDAKCNYFNETWLAFTGRSLEQEIGNGWAEGVHPEDFDRCVAYYLDRFGRREAFEMQYRLRRSDGEFRWIFDHGVPFDDDTGNFAGFIGSCVDMRDRSLAQATQEQYTEEQLALARDFERWILAIVSHDIRNPLQSIALAAHGMKRLPDTQGVIHRQADVVSRGVKRIEDIVDDLLDLARVREGSGIGLDPKPANLRVMCRQVIDELESIARDRSFTFDCDVDGAGAWDEARVLQAISNLASNALKHGTPGTPVHMRITGEADQLAIEVHNRGGIPSELLPNIFEPFQSGKHHGSRGDGLGLGLFIANAIARAHGGVLEVSSASEATMFRLVLPRHTRPPEAA